MNLRSVLYLLALTALVIGEARADVTPLPPDPGISDAAKTALTSASYTDEISQKIHDEVTKLVQNSSDQPTVSMVRQWLIGEAAPTTIQSTPAYQEAYTQALNAEFVSLLAQPGLPVAVRLNFALVIYSLPGKAENLAPAVVLLLNDKSAPVVMWAVRACGAILPRALMNKNFGSDVTGKLLAALTKAVKDHPNGPVSGIVADEAYLAINWKLRDYASGMSLPATAMSTLIDANLDLLKVRLDIYKTSGVPESPLSDTYPSYLMLDSAEVWNVMTTDQRQRAVQLAVNFISLAGQRAASRVGNQNSDLIGGNGALNEEGKWINSLGNFQDIANADIQAAGTTLQRLTAASSPDKIKDAIAAVLPAMKELWPSLDAPPDLPGTKSAADTTSSTTPASSAQQ